MISKTDQKILLELRKNGRVSYSELAKKLGLNPITVTKRINHLLKLNAMSIRALPNPYALGLVANALIAIKADPLKINNIFENLSDVFNVHLFLTVFGRFDIFIAAYFPTWEELHSFINTDLPKIEGIVWLEPYFVKERRKGYPPFDEDVFKNHNRFIPTEFDWKLIKELVKDGRQTIRSLSKKIGVHQSTISRRINYFVKNNILMISVLIDTEYLGIFANAYIALEVDPAQVENICKILSSYPEVHLIITLINGFGIIIGIHTWDNKGLYAFIMEKLACIEGIHSTETFIRAELKKRYYGKLSADYFFEYDEL